MDALSETGYRNLAADAHVTETGAAAPAWRYWTLSLLVAVATFAMVDKMLMAILIDPLKRDFGMSDTQAGVLTGISFSLFFALAGIPMGIAADRLHRRNLIAVCMTIWSLATVACGLTTGFAQMLTLRFVVGAGESGATPSAVSMISDLFQARERAKAVAIYYMSTPFGSGLGMTVGAILVHHYGWRNTLYIAGIPGLLVVLILLLTVKEPGRLSVYGGSELAGQAPAVRETLGFIFRRRSLLHLGAAITLVTIAINAFGMWMFAFFTRVHGIPPQTAGWEISVATYPASAIGMVLVGIAVDRLSARDERWRVWIPAMLGFACLPLALGAVGIRDTLTALVFTGFWMVGGTAWYGAAYGVCQSLVQPRMRATLAAILLLLTTLIGFGIGPLLTGSISDYFAPTAGAMSVGYGMVAANLLALWGGVHFMLAGRTLRRDLESVSETPALV